jgi:hypothetical protein
MFQYHCYNFGDEKSSAFFVPIKGCQEGKVDKKCNPFKILKQFWDDHMKVD